MILHKFLRKHVNTDRGTADYILKLWWYFERQFCPFLKTDIPFSRQFWVLHPAWQEGWVPSCFPPWGGCSPWWWSWWPWWPPPPPTPTPRGPSSSRNRQTTSTSATPPVGAGGKVYKFYNCNQLSWFAFPGGEKEFRVMKGKLHPYFCLYKTKNL